MSTLRAGGADLYPNWGDHMTKPIQLVSLESNHAPSHWTCRLHEAINTSFLYPYPRFFFQLLQVDLGFLPFAAKSPE